MSNSTDLVPWLLAQIAEDDQQAQAATEFNAAEWSCPLAAVVDTGADGLRGLLVVPDRGLGYHIARWHPARALAECESKRRIIQLHGVRTGTGGDWDTDPAALCDEDSDLHPCPTLRLLAEPFAGRPGYREEWRP